MSRIQCATRLWPLNVVVVDSRSVVVVVEVRVALLPIQLAYEPLAPLYANCRHGRSDQEEVDTGTFDKQYFCHSSCSDQGPK